MKYESSAVGMSWEALCEVLKNQAEMSKTFFSMFGSVTEASLKSTADNATFTKNSILDDAHNQITNGIAGIIGSVAGIGATVIGTVMSMKMSSEATKLGQANPRTMTGLEEVGGAPAGNGRSGVVGGNMGDTELSEMDQTIGAGRPSRTQLNADKQLVEDNRAKAKVFQRNAANAVQTGNNIGQSLSGLATGIGSTISGTKFMTDKAEQQAAATLAQGVAQAQATAANMQLEAQRGRDSATQSDVQLIQSLIQASSVRG